MISEGCKKHGMTLLYHNHDFEFAKTFGRYLCAGSAVCRGSCGCAGCRAGHLLDQGWRTDPSEWLKKYSGRRPLVHVKDFRRKADGVDLLALGEGEQDFPTLVKTAKSAVHSGWLLNRMIIPTGHPWEI